MIIFVLWQSYNDNSYYGNDPQKSCGFGTVDMVEVKNCCHMGSIQAAHDDLKIWPRSILHLFFILDKVRSINAESMERRASGL